MKKIIISLLSFVLAISLAPKIASAATTGTVTVIKQVVNTHTGTKTPANFNIIVQAQNGILAPSIDTFSISFPGSSAGVPVTINAGTYSITETPDVGYSASYSADCSGTLAAGDNKTCTIINSDVPAKVKVIVDVSNTHSGTQQPSNFTVNFASTGGVFTPALDTASISFFGTSAGTDVTFGMGTYNVTLSNLASYSFSYSAGCSGTGALGYTATCTVTAQDPASSGGGSGSGSGGGSVGGTGTGTGGGSGPSLTSAPAGEVAGAFTKNPNLGKNDPQVLGAATSLPRTGFGVDELVSLLYFSLLGGLAFVAKKKHI